MAACVQGNDAWDGSAPGIRAHEAVEQVAQQVVAAVSGNVAMDRHGALQAASAALKTEVSLGKMADRGYDQVGASDVIFDVGGH